MQSPISSTPVSSWVLTRSHGMHSPPIPTPAPAVVPTRPTAHHLLKALGPEVPDIDLQVELPKLKRLDDEKKWVSKLLGNFGFEADK